MLPDRGPVSSAIDAADTAPRNQVIEMKQKQPMSNNGEEENRGHAVQHDAASNNVEQHPEEHPQAPKQTA